MQKIVILLNKSFTSSTVTTAGDLTLSNNYYSYANSNGGGIVNFSNVRGFLNDSKNQQVINDFFAYLTGSTTQDQTINIVNSDQKLSEVFNDYYQRLITSSSTVSSSQNSNSTVIAANSSQEFSISLVDTTSRTNSTTTSTNSTNSSLLNSAAAAAIFGNINSSTPNSSESVSSANNNNATNSADYIPGVTIQPVQIPQYSMTAVISKNLANGARAIEKIFYHNWENTEVVGITQSMSAIPMSINGGLIQTREKSIWLDTTTEEGYYINVFLNRGTNQLSRNEYSADYIQISKNNISFYPQYSGITYFISTEDTESTKINTIINSFVDINLELDETKFFAFARTATIATDLDTSFFDPFSIGP